MKRIVSVLALSLVACGGAGAESSTTSTTSSEPPIASAWRARCGQCHRPVEPKSRDRAALETALQRHRNRTRLTEEQWAQMVDFLAR